MAFDNLFSLEGKTAVITGAAQGLGREIAMGLARYGASLVLADAVDPKETYALIQQQNAQGIAVQTDISDEDQVRHLLRSAMDAYGKIDILVNNAGVSQLGYTATEDLLAEEWDRVMDINLKGTFLCCKTMGKAMIDAGCGSIVNIASTAGITGIPRAPAYCASKAGIILLTKSLALEWARHNIRVNAVAPHYLATDLTKELTESEKIHAALVKQVPLGRLGKPSEVFGAVLYLSSGASTFTTGAVVPVDGGYLAK